MYAALKYDRSRAKLIYSDFCSHAPQTRYTDWESVRSQMNKVHRPHRESGYIAKVDFQQTADSEGQPDWIMFYMPGPKAKAEFKAFTKRGGPTVLEIEPPEPAPPIADSELEVELIQHGVTAGIAAELVSHHSEEKIRAQMERLDWLLEKKPDKIEEPAAYLVQAIKNDFAAPKGFVSKAERQRREEARRAKERKAAEEHRRKHEENARQQAEQAAVQAYWKSLTPEAQAELEAAALAQAGPETITIEDGPLHESLRRLSQHRRRDDYIRQLLQDQDKFQLVVD